MYSADILSCHRSFSALLLRAFRLCLTSGDEGVLTEQVDVFFSVFRHEEAGITGASSHSGRRQFVTELADKGINARVIQALARHKHLNTTMRYIDINENKMRAAIEQL